MVTKVLAAESNDTNFVKALTGLLEKWKDTVTKYTSSHRHLFLINYHFHFKLYFSHLLAHYPGHIAQATVMSNWKLQTDFPVSETCPGLGS